MIEFGTGQGYLKAGFLGFNKSGKTHTAMLLALEVRRRFKLDGPIALFDTEASGEYIAQRVKAATGKPMVGMKSRSFGDLMAMAQDCQGKVSVLIVDSMTHVARELCAAYLQQINKAREQSGKSKKTRIEFQDQAIIKPKFATWNEFYLNSPLHIIICGRAGFDWDFEEHEQADGSVKKELIKTGIKMKVEADSEFGFEPSLLVEMKRLQVPNDDGFLLVHRATVIGDRFDAMDGQTIDNPKGDWFAPHLDLLTPGATNAVDTTPKTPCNVDESGDAEWQREKREKTKLLEEIEAAVVKVMPGQSAAEKREKIIVIEKAFGTASWTAIGGISISRLQTGLADLRKLLAEVKLPVKKGGDA